MRGIAGLPKLNQEDRIAPRLFKAMGPRFFIFWESPVMEVLIESL
jgi:hypothetical protein